MISTVGKRKPAHPDGADLFAELGQRIKHLRKDRGWSLNDMHLMHGYVPSQWQHIEKGKPITIDTILRIADIFDETLVSLFQSIETFPRHRQPE